MAVTSLRRAPRELGYRGFQVLAYVREQVSTNGQAPSYAEIRDEFGFNQDCQVRAIIVRLENRGLVRRVGSGRVRRIRLLNVQ